ncbi:hypothetical protein [Tsukamurella hominis]|uniref:glycine-rich domain-containing protein n=1 Tax=Tsukamurella hominis TaxID=1970232 RepID=UPI0039EC8D9C
MDRVIPGGSQGGGWQIVPQLAGSDGGIGTDYAATIPALTGLDVAVAADRAAVILTSTLTGRDPAAGTDWARLGLGGLDLAAAFDAATLGFTGRDHSGGFDLSTAVGLALPGDDVAVGGDNATALAVLTGREHAASTDLAASGFTAQSAISTPVTATSTIAIPSWCRYIDAIVLGGGGGGAGGTQGFPGWGGIGGAPGGWNAIRWDRGAFGNTWLTVTVSVGAGGPGGSANNAGTDGNPTTATIAGVGTITGAGGAKGSGSSLVNNDGASAGNYTYQGTTYSGGGANGGVPGGGGKGGSGSVWPGSPGSGAAGGRGQAWLIFSM